MNFYFLSILEVLKSVQLFNLIIELSRFSFKAMTKKKEEKGNMDDENDKGQRETTVVGSVLENQTSPDSKTNKSRKCKVESSNKTSKILKVSRTRSKRISESSCESSAKDGESNSVKDSREHVEELHDKKLEISEEKSFVHSTESSNNVLPTIEEIPVKVNSDKYSELLNYFNGKEEDFNNFIHQYNKWQQSNTGPKTQIKKKSIKPQTLKKPMKAKILHGTPTIKLISPKSKKSKKSSKKSSVPTYDDLPNSDTLVSVTAGCNSLTLNTESFSSNLNAKSENVVSAEVSLSNNVHLDVIPEGEDKINNSKTIELKTEHKSDMSDENICNDEINQKCEKDSVNEDKIEKSEANESNNAPLDLQNSFISHADCDSTKNENFLNINNGCDKDDNLLENIMEFCDEDKDSYTNIDSIVKESFSETILNESIESLDTVKSDRIASDKIVDSVESQTCRVSTKPLISVSHGNSATCGEEINQNVEIIYNGIIKSGNIDNNTREVDLKSFDLKESETESVLKRKRNLTEDKNKFINKTKKLVRPESINSCKKMRNSMRLEESKSNEHQNHLSLETPVSKWNTEETNLLSEELIYSDEDKANNMLHNSDDCELLEAELPTLKDTSYNNQYSMLSRSADSLLDLHERTFVKSLDLNQIDSFNNTQSDIDNCFQGDEKLSERSANSGGEVTPQKGVENNIDEETPQRRSYAEWKDNKKIASQMKNARLKKLIQQMKIKEKVIKISGKSKTQMKTKGQGQKIKKSLLMCQNASEENSNDHKMIKEKVSKEEHYCHDTLLKKMRKKYRSKHKSILETDLPIVEINYKGECLHGILGSEHNASFFEMYEANRKNKEDILDSSHTKEILINFLRPLCSDFVRNGVCNNQRSCKKEHMVGKDVFINMNKYDAWLVVAFALRISKQIPANIIEAILEFLSYHKAKKKVLLVSRHIILSKQNDPSVLKSCWEQVFKALEHCELERWEAIRAVIRFVVDTCPSLKAEVFNQLLKIWNVHGSQISNTWSIVEILITEKKIVLSSLILTKIMGEVVAVGSQDKNVYRIIVQQLTSLSKDNFSQMSYRLLNDFLRKLAQEGLHNEEKTLREKMNVAYQSSFCSQPMPMVPKGGGSTGSSLRRCKSMTNLQNLGLEVNVHSKVHEEEKMEAAIFRGLQCSNYDSVIKVIISCSKKKFINNILSSICKYVKDKHSYSILKNIFTKLMEYPASNIDETKELIGNITVTVMLDYVLQYNWKEANNFFLLLEEHGVNKYVLKSLSDGTLRPVRLAVIYSEIHFYNGRYKDAIGVFLSTKLVNPDASNWLVPGGSQEDFNVINVMISFLMNELIKKKIINYATMLFKAVLEVQTSLTEPIDIGGYFEMLLYKLFEHPNEFPETAVKLFIRVSSKDSNFTLFGLTYRALIILAFRNHKRSIIKDIFYKAINEYVYPLLEENENVITLLRSHTEEEVIVYITEWIARFKEKIFNADNSAADHQIQIKFKDVVLEDFLDDHVLGIPSILKEVDQSLPGAIKRLEIVLKRLHIKYKQIKKDTLSIDPTSFQNLFNKMKF